MRFICIHSVVHCHNCVYCIYLQSIYWFLHCVLHCTIQLDARIIINDLLTYLLTYLLITHCLVNLQSVRNRDFSVVCNPQTSRRSFEIVADQNLQAKPPGVSTPPLGGFTIITQSW